MATRRVSNMLPTNCFWIAYDLLGAGNPQCCLPERQAKPLWRMNTTLIPLLYDSLDNNILSIRIVVRAISVQGKENNPPSCFLLVGQNNGSQEWGGGGWNKRAKDQKWPLAGKCYSTWKTTHKASQGRMLDKPPVLGIGRSTLAQGRYVFSPAL